MRDHSFPDVDSNNFDEKSSSSSNEYYHLQNREPLLPNKCNCSNQLKTANPSDEYKILQKTVERYVKKLSFLINGFFMFNPDRLK